MLFNSYVFWLFYLIVIVLYWRLRHDRQNRLLLLASFVFYGWWDWRFLSLLAISAVVDFFVSNAIATSVSRPRRKALLLVSMVCNLGLLGTFKYYDFFISELCDLLSLIGFNASLPTLNVLLPVGISFYTFQTMSYTIDVYFGKARPASSLLDFSLFVAFFPQLVAGPIERYNHLMGQITSPRVLREGDFAEGLYHVLLGLFKKVVIADNMAGLVNAVFAAEQGELGGFDYLMGVYAFAFQIYGDFSGYSSMAQGIAKWMGFDLMYNFRMPYFAVSPSDFWNRWHISLSSWLRDYLYIPLGGNRHGSVNTYRNLMITMLLGGLWHGASWTFITWGGFHGGILAIYRFFGSSSRATSQPRGQTLRNIVGVVVMFHLTCLGWLLFRAQGMGQVWDILRNMATNLHPSPFTCYAGVLILFFVAPLMLLEFWTHRRNDMTALLKAAWPIRAAVYSYMVMMLCCFPPEVSHAFIYFQF